MDTRTGEIFPPELMDLHAKTLEQERDMAKLLAGVEEERLDALARIDDALANDALVPVSDVVAQKVKLGNRELERRKKRKAAKGARKANR